MCKYISLLSEAQELEEYFDAKYEGEPYHKEFPINGFANPVIPIIMYEEPSVITSAELVLIPSWSKN